MTKVKEHFTEADKLAMMTVQQKREYNREKMEKFQRRKFARKRSKFAQRKDEMKDSGGWKHILGNSIVMDKESADRTEKRRQEEREYLLSLKEDEK